MTRLDNFGFIALTPPGLPDAAMARAAAIAGEIGIVNGELAPSMDALRTALAALRGCPRERCGVRLDLSDNADTPDILKNPPPHLGWVLVSSAEPRALGECVHNLRDRGIRVLVETLGLEQAQAAEAAGADGVIAKGNESGGWVGGETAFVLLQRLRASVKLPVWVQGGIGPHTVASAYVGGAVGVVLDGQLALLRESPLPDEAKNRIARMDGTETVCLGEELSLPFRALAAPRSQAVAELQALATRLAAGTESAASMRTAWREAVRRRVKRTETGLWPLGQDACLARVLAERYGAVGRALHGLRAELRSHLRSASRKDVLMEGSAWTRAHDTVYPIAQGPMTRVSDTPAFAREVAAAGGLPFLALGMQREREIETLLTETRACLGDRPWGAGLLGFLESPLQEEQLAVVLKHRPPFALIAGGQPEQARRLETAGIPTYLHVPTPGLLMLFIEEGARRFVFEGRECGGHVGPLSSFVLWEQAARTLAETVPASELGACHILLAGGIHDAHSAAMAVAGMASLAERGVTVGVLMGTAYLFTREAVASGAILAPFQRQALTCRHTVLLETGPGHVVRCAPTPYAQAFAERKARLQAEGVAHEQVRAALEAMNIGRLRLAAKGVTRRNEAGHDLETVDEAGQLAEGLYMLGQAAGLREEVCTVNELHCDVSEGGTELLREAARNAGEGAPRIDAGREGIAIVGMSCLLPGAQDIDRFWTNVLNKTNAIREVPADRWDWKLYFDERRETADRVYARWGGFLDPVPFDPAAWGMPPSSLASIEPIQLLALETARAALRDAGYEDRSFPRENTSVIIGVSGGLAELGQNYVLRSALAARPDQPALAGFHRELPEWTEDSFAGILLNVIAGRIANRLDLGGPSFAVDAACASSLAAVYLACRELESGASDMILVGGADTFQTPFNYLCFCKTQALSPRGRCRTFDHTADGTCISEGLSMLALKRLADAELDGDRIYAVIRGVGASSDGRAKGLTAPSPEGQARALHRAYAAAGFSPATVGLVEAHGTGTVAGDAAEIESLRRVFDEAGTAAHSVALGSVKSMIGHTKGAAGVTGLLKVALALHRKVLPATIGVEKPNPSLSGGALYANAETRPWIHASEDAPRRAAVSAFGFGGANYHAVVEEYGGGDSPAASAQWPCELFLWREDSVADILKRIGGLLEDLKSGAQPALKDLAFTIWKRARGKTDGAALAIVAATLDDVAAKLETARGRLAADPATSVWDGGGIYFTPRPLAAGAGLAFLFPGQGSQYPDMLRELAVHFHEVREAFETADRTLAGRLERPLSAYVFPPPRFGDDEERAARKAVTATNVAQPALGAAAVGLLDLLRALNVRPALCAGHSYGEYAALCAAGCLTPDQLFAVSEARGRFIVEEARGDLGTMAAVEADEEKTRALVGDLPDLWIANLNSPRQTIVSGTKTAVAEALKRLETHGVAGQPLPVACAFHSPLVAPAKERLKEFLGGTRFEAPTARVFSNTTGAEHAADPEAIRLQLAEHLVSPVRFVAEIEAMYAAGARVFVEVGPRQVLTGLTEQILAERERLVVPLETRKRSGLEGFLHALAQLAAHGAPADLERLFEGRQPREHALDRLTEETRNNPPPATAWLVDGGRAVPLRAADTAALNVSSLPARSLEANPQEIAMPTSTGVGLPAPIPESTRGAPPHVASLLHTHEQVMQRLLDTHRRVMLAALGKTEAAAVDPPAASATTRETKREVASAAPAQPLAVAAAPASPPDPMGPTGVDHVRGEVLRIVGERTGYPPDMLDVNADLEADLGIDSIKRVEIAGRLRKAFPHIGATADTSKVGNLASLRTLSALIERIVSVPAEGAKEKGAGGASASTPTAAGAEAGHPKEDKPSKAGVHVPRFMMRMEEAPVLDATGAIPNDGVFLITDDEKGLAEAVAEAIVGRGGHAVIVSARDGRTSVVPRYQADFSKTESLHLLVAAVRKAEGRVAGIVHLLPLRHRPAADATPMEVWRRTLQEEVKGLFFLVQAAAEDLKTPSPAGRARVLAVVEANRACPGHGGIAGLVNALATEWPGLVGRTLALDSAEPVPSLAPRILRELQDDSPVRFVRLHNGQRQVVRIELAELDTGSGEQMRIGSDWVILLTGGACGITAQVAIEFAERFKPTLVLTGRSPLPEAEEAPLTRGVESPAEIRRILAGSLAGPGGKAALADVEAAYRRLCREREMRTTLAALRATGARVTYLQADARDAKAFGETIDRIHAEFGRLDGVIHGAGVIEDRRVEEKTPESFDRVFDTKADGAFVLAQRLRLDSLKFAAFFSSVAYLGNAGQSDYAAANGVLNALARNLDRRTPGRVVSVLWGPWQNAGMASEEVQRRFRERGVQIIPPAAGRRCLVDELLCGRKGDVEVLFGDAPYAPVVGAPAAGLSTLPLIGPESVVHSNGSIEVACVLAPSRHVYLRDHMLDGKPVFPAAMAMELLAETARAAAPDAGRGVEIVSLEVLNGIVLEEAQPLAVRVIGQPSTGEETGGDSVTLAMRIASAKESTRVHYRAKVRLGAQMERPRLAASDFAGLDPFRLSVTEAYGQWLFQGRCFAGITAIEGIRGDAIAGTLQSVAPAVCLPGLSAGDWLLDPTVVDASLQLVILWERHWHDMTPLPMQIARFRLFESLSGQPVRCLVKAVAGEGGGSLTADIYYADLHGRVLAVLDGLQCACTKALNRLSERVEPKPAGHSRELRLEALR
jgi:acyl transferase domain-containing protein/NAD(P)H-dependent flavin oxidoreductase YrpB (nitropropane dioxygenase family)/NAD(P)-dependent dehydrogenase (short-subunit alcohol dehydrogenase family)/acyl carrier protein